MIGRLFRSIIRRGNPVSFGDQLRSDPVSRVFGLDRGTPLDRYYIEDFLANYTDDLRGTVIEIGDNRYTEQLGRSNRLRALALHFTGKAGPGVIIGDLSQPESLPEGIADCIICTQTLNFIFETAAAIDGCAQVLRPGGILLGTVAGIAQISRYDHERWGDYWRFTPEAISRMLSERFDTKIRVYGNLLIAKAFLDGLAVEDLPDKSLLDREDPDYPVTVGFRGVRKD